MPIFEYRCSDCGQTFEELVSSGDRDKVQCPGCGSKSTDRQLSTFCVGKAPVKAGAGPSCCSTGCCGR